MIASLIVGQAQRFVAAVKTNLRPLSVLNQTPFGVLRSIVYHINSNRGFVFPQRSISGSMQ